mgnify:CR=1 FL=1
MFAEGPSCGKFSNLEDSRRNLERKTLKPPVESYEIWPFLRKTLFKEKQLWTSGLERSISATLMSPEFTGSSIVWRTNEFS